MDRSNASKLILCITVSASATVYGAQPPRLPVSSYNVEIRPDNYHYHEQQLNEWFIQCYRRKQPADRYWHCNATDNNSIQRFRTPLKDPALAFAPPRQEQNSALKKVTPETEIKLTPLSPKQTEIPAQNQVNAGPEQKAVAQPVSIAPESKAAPVQPTKALLTNPNLEPESAYLLQLAAFQNLQSALNWQARYAQIDTQVIKTPGKFTQWYNILTAQPIDYIDAMTLSEKLKKITGETPWIREQEEVL